MRRGSEAEPQRIKIASGANKSLTKSGDLDRLYREGKISLTEWSEGMYAQILAELEREYGKLAVSSPHHSTRHGSRTSP